MADFSVPILPQMVQNRVAAQVAEREKMLNAAKAQGLSAGDLLRMQAQARAQALREL